MAKTKFFRVAVEGDTIDGRKIERSWLTDAAATYNPATYAARVNMEHIRGVTADKPFKAYGDVLALKTEEVELDLAGKKEKRVALFAEIEATDELVAMNRDKQKLYTSIEIQPNFANTGKAYMVGLAVTDSPASLGTEVLTFAVKHPGALRNGPALQAEGNVFSIGEETKIELAVGAEPAADSPAGMFAAATAYFKQLTGTATPPVTTTPAKSEPETPPTPANDNDAKFAIVAKGLETLTAAMAKVNDGVTALRTDHDALKASVEGTEQSNQGKRSLSTGGSGAIGAIDF